MKESTDKKEKDIQDQVIVEPKSIINNKPLELKLLQLRDLTARWGVLDDLQSAQLTLWPFAVDPSLDKNNVEVDFDHHKVFFHWLRENDKTDKGYKARLQELDEKVRFLLGNHWQIQILSNSKVIFKTDVKPARKPAKPNRRRNSRKSGRTGKPRRKS